MAELDGEYQTIIGPDAEFKGELAFEKAVRIDGKFEGHIRSKGSLTISEAGKAYADIEAANMKLEGECKGTVVISEKLQLLATAKMEGDVRTTRLEIADGAIFCGNIMVGQAATDAAKRMPMGGAAAAGPVRRPVPPPQPLPSGAGPAGPGQPQPAPRPRPHEAPATAV